MFIPPKKENCPLIQGQEYPAVPPMIETIVSALHRLTATPNDNGFGSVGYYSDKLFLLSTALISPFIDASMLHSHPQQLSENEVISTTTLTRRFLIEVLYSK